ncbi:MAG: hypothetical protein ACT4R6_09450 [Gemmatimonadaceae bacterium]
MSASYGQFYEGDEISIASGVAGIAQDNPAYLYRYGPQLGYYRLVQGITEVAGGVPAIPIVMVTLSVIAGTVIPVLGLYAFRDDLTRVERWLLAGTLAANPILWTSSRYGNTIMLGAALAVAAAALLSNRPRRLGETVALGLFGLAILVRADIVLLSGGLGVLLWRNHGSWRAAAARIAVLGMLLALVYAALFAADPHLQQILGDVRSHLTTPDRTRFFEFLVWAVSPFPLAYAILGLRELEPARRWLLATIAAWCLPPFAFYFASTTTPRYFVLTVFALAAASAVGMVAIARLLPRWPRTAWAIVLLSGSLHLFVGLGNFMPSVRRGWLTDARTGSHDGDVLAGAFLYNSYVQNDVRSAGILHPVVGRRSPVERSYAAALRDIGAGRHRDEEIVLIYSGGEGHAVHFFAQQGGARMLAKGRRGVLDDWVTYGLGGARLTTFGVFQFDADSARRVPVESGQRLWWLSRQDDAARLDPRITARLPAGIVLEDETRVPGTPRLWSYRVAAGP